MKSIMAKLLALVMTFSLLPLSVYANGAASHTITFPANDRGKTEFNTSVYEIEPFDLTVTLPSEWTIREREKIVSVDSGIALSGVWSVHDIYNENSESVGAVGYNTYEPYPDEEDSPRAIYNQIALGNDYHFDVRDSYAVINETDSSVTATADVYYSASINNGVEKHNRGILSYNKDILVYVAMELANDKITEKQITDIAKTIRLDKVYANADIAETNLNGLRVYQYQSPRYIEYADGSEETFADGDMLLLFVNGSIVKNTEIFTSDNRTMVPIRLISETLGAEVVQDGSANSVTVKDNGITLELTIGDKNPKLNGNTMQIDTAPLIVDGQTFVPLRFIAESLGYKVDWYDGGGTLHGDGTGIPEAHYVPYVPQVMISRYPNGTEAISKQDALEILRENLIRAYENRYDKDFEPLEKAQDEWYEESDTLRYGITNLSMAHIMSENDRFYTIHFTWEFMIDKYTGTVIEFYNGDVGMFTGFDPESPGALVFAG